MMDLLQNTSFNVSYIELNNNFCRRSVEYENKQFSTMFFTMFSKMGILLVLFPYVDSIQLKLSDLGFCFIRLNYLNFVPFRNVRLAGDIFDKVLKDNRGSVFMLETEPLRKSVGFLRQQLLTSKCILYVVATVPVTHFDLGLLEYLTFSGTFAYQADYKTSIIMVWPCHVKLHLSQNLGQNICTRSGVLLS